MRWALALAVLGIVGLQWRAATSRRALTELRTTAGDARTAARACSQALRASEAEFQLLAERVDSLRVVVDGLEALDPRGVPADRYEEYLAVVDTFNDGVERWESEADRIRSAETECRAVVERYNLLADSLRGVTGGPDPEM